MIKEVKMFTVICDNCGEDVCDGEDYSCWGEIGHVKDIAKESDWEEMDGKDYCPDCYEYDEEDNLIIKPKP